MNDLLVHSSVPDANGSVLCVSPESAGWEYVGFEVIALDGMRAVRRDTGRREVCVVVVDGTVTVRSPHGDWAGLGGRANPWAGPPEAAYLPADTTFSLEGDGEVALCWAPAPRGGAQPRRLPCVEIEPETRGYGGLERTIHPILMGNREAESLLVCEVLTPAGHWSSYPPHKHDRDDPPAETLLEETYYHRVSPARGFALQRVYTEDGSLDETFAIGDRDCVLVPRGYHAVSAPPGYELYYLNVMAGPTRLWAVANDPDHEWTLVPEEQR